MSIAALTTTESTRLAELESTIERGLKTFVEVGLALMEIREARLYRATHSTFEAYCKDRWHFSASRGRQLVAAAKVAGELQSVTRVTVPTERHARALGQLVHAKGLEIAADLWERISKDGDPTVAALTEAIHAEIGGLGLIEVARDQLDAAANELGRAPSLRPDPCVVLSTSLKKRTAVPLSERRGLSPQERTEATALLVKLYVNDVRDEDGNLWADRLVEEAIADLEVLQAGAIQ